MLLLAAIAEILGAMAGGAGGVRAPARAAAMREAAEWFVSPGGAAAYSVPVQWPPGSGATAALRP